MLAPFAWLLFPFAGLFAVLAICCLFQFKKRSWYILFWLPIALWNLFGTFTFLSVFGFFQKVSHESGEAAYFAGGAAVLIMGRTILFVVGLILCCVAHPKIESLRWPMVVLSVLLCSTLLGTMTWQARRYQPVQVLDADGKPISLIQIHFDGGDDGYSNEGVVETDSDGKAVIRGFKAQRLNVSVESKGYYTLNGEGSACADFRNLYERTAVPIIFHLRKKGEGADLIRYDKSFVMPKDGTPVLIDLPAGKVVASSQNAVQVEAWINDSEKIDRWKFNWKCRVSVPNGGLQIYDEVFPFLAPEENYVLEEVIDMPATNNPSWSNQARRNYYIRTADGKYGRMVFTMVPAGDHFCELNLYFNPTDSRNLEPK